MTDAAALVAALVARRRVLGLTQMDICRMAGVSQPTISRIEAGRGAPALSTVLAYAQAVGLGVTLDERK